MSQLCASIGWPKSQVLSADSTKSQHDWQRAFLCGPKPIAPWRFVAYGSGVGIARTLFGVRPGLCRSFEGNAGPFARAVNRTMGGKQMAFVNIDLDKLPDPNRIWLEAHARSCRVTIEAAIIEILTRAIPLHHQPGFTWCMRQVLHVLSELDPLPNQRIALTTIFRAGSNARLDQRDIEHGISELVEGGYLRDAPEHVELTSAGYKAFDHVKRSPPSSTPW